MKANQNLATFDAHRLARLEKENYVAYYQKRWLRLLRVSVSMVREAYQLSLLQAIRAAYLVARAEIAFAPYPDNDVLLAEAYMRRFFTLLNRVHHLDIDVKEAAHLEVYWWIVHRKLFAQDENQELVDALAKSLAATYQIDENVARESAYHRARGMLYSDRWVNSGLEANSPLLVQEEQALAKGYSLLKAALTPEDRGDQGYQA